MPLPQLLRRAARALLAALVLAAGLGLPSGPHAAAAFEAFPGVAAGGSAGGTEDADLAFSDSQEQVGGEADGGYLMASSDGTVYTFSKVASTAATDFRLNKPVVDIAGTPSGEGYWLVAGDGGVFTFGDARYFGSLGNLRLNRPVVGMAGTPSGRGYWMVAADGGIFSFGDAAFYGSTGSMKLNQPITGMAATPSGRGYWLVAVDGGIFSFGDAQFYGSTGALSLSKPIVGMAGTQSGHGYWLVASDGGIFSYGDATFLGSTGAKALSQPIVGMAATATGTGYWLGAADGGVFAFGDAKFKGSPPAGKLDGRIVGLMPQGGDVRAPVLRHLSFSPARVDTSQGPATLRFRANFTDDLSGHGTDAGYDYNRGGSQLIFESPAGHLSAVGLNVIFTDANRIAGDRRDGIYRAYAQLPANSAPGTWRVSSIVMADAVGNMVNIDGAVLAQAGFPTTFEQVGAGDTEPPKVTELSVSEPEIDTSAAPVDVKIRARVVDGGSGVAFAAAGFGMTNSFVNAYLTLVSGTGRDGVWEGTATVPRYAHQGWWQASVQVRDGAGNVGHSGLAFPSAGARQVGASDDTPPRRGEVTVSPAVIDTSAGPATVTVTVRATDDLAGLAVGQGQFPGLIRFQSPSQQSAVGYLVLVSGDPHDAVLQATVTIPRYSEQGTWTLDQMTLSDGAFNRSEEYNTPWSVEVLRTGNPQRP